MERRNTATIRWTGVFSLWVTVFSLHTNRRVCRHENGSLEEDWKNQRSLKPWTWPPWVRCYCPVGMNGDDRWAGRGWVGFGRRLSDSSRESEGVAGGLWGWLDKRHAPSPVFWSAKASTKLWQKRVDGLNIWNVNSTKRNPEQMWNNYWSDNYRHVCHYIRVLQHSWDNISKVQVLWWVSVCVCVSAYVRQITPFLCAWLHPYIENLLSLTVQEWIRHRSLFLWWRDKIKPYHKLPAVWATLQVIRASATHAFSLFAGAGLLSAAFLFLRIWKRCLFSSRPDGCWCCSTERLPGADGRPLTAGCCGDSVAGDDKKNNWTCIHGKSARRVQQCWSTDVGFPWKPRRMGAGSGALNYRGKKKKHWVFLVSLKKKKIKKINLGCWVMKHSRRMREKMCERSSNDRPSYFRWVFFEKVKKK